MESSSNHNKNKKYYKPKPNQKQIWKVKEKIETRNWLDLPLDVTIIILLKLGSVQILESVQYVCSSLYNLCKHPLIWRSIDMHKGDIDIPDDFQGLVKMAKHAIDLSCGRCVDINIDCFANDELLRYIAKRLTQLKRLRLVACHNITNKGLSKAVSKLPLLEEIDISLSSGLNGALVTIGQCCPLLRSLKLNHLALKHFNTKYVLDQILFDEEAHLIAENMPHLHHLMLFGNPLSNKGLEAILDSCANLISLDLRRCFNINLLGDLGKRCAEQIKYLRRPFDSVDDYPLPADVDEGSDDGYYLDEYDEYDDFTQIPEFNYFSDFDGFSLF